ncbi:hypothetical protein C2G38_2173201 [Gigaspora rosea]|uniref:Uncharacterized protein n=1 Tax=Gigaspora rosea TaxID=44941 RepID=A0A397VJS8_9GLOM|nr:hypothetical protein C2G38_2173201 [Gigaspora rosea]
MQYLMTCDDSDFRVLYTIYFPKDGFLGPRLGHDHDFEEIIVTWKNISGYWYHGELIMSRHHDWRHKPWSSVASFNYNDPASKYTDNEYRSDNYQFWVNNSLIEVTDDNFYGQNFKKYNWGEVTPPTDIAQNLCDK